MVEFDVMDERIMFRRSSGARRANKNSFGRGPGKRVIQITTRGAPREFHSIERG